MAGRKAKFGDNGKKLLVVYGEELDAAIERCCALVTVAGMRGSTRPMNRTEFFREGARLLVHHLEEGAFEPPAIADRPHEAAIVEVLPPPRPRRRRTRRARG